MILMNRPRNIDFQILSSLFKHSKVSDRKLAKIIGVSQPTITRRRAKLEKNVIENYTIIPKWEALGYTLLVITLIKIRKDALSPEEFKKRKRSASEWMMKHPNVIMHTPCRGSNIDSFMISVHKSYGDYDQLVLELRRDKGDRIEDIQPLLVNLEKNRVSKPLNLNYLSEAK